MRILIVDDSALIRNILKQIFINEEKIDVIGEASNGEMAIELNKKLGPDLIIMDIDMPVMNGLDAIQIIMKEKPTPILVLSHHADASNSFNAMKYGALEVMKKPELTQFNNKEFYKSFINKLILLSKSPVIKRYVFNNQKTVNNDNEKTYKLMVLGASTGGPLAVSNLLGNLPKNFPIGIVYVQHLEPGFEDAYVDWLNTESALDVRLAKEGDEPKGGLVLVAPTKSHLVFNGHKLVLDDSPPVLNQKPSVDLLFQSAAKSFGSACLAVLLTGMGRDGAAGCVDIKNKGGFTLVQDEQSSTIFGMPKAAIEKGGASKVLPLKEMPAFLLKLLKVGS